MRISCRNNDSGFAEWSFHGGYSTKWKITVDGVELMGAITADDQTGEVLRFARGPNGGILRENGEAKTELIRGVVVIEKLISGGVDHLTPRKVA